MDDKEDEHLDESIFMVQNGTKQWNFYVTYELCSCEDQIG
jgi:hypothetical protein